MKKAKLLALIVSVVLVIASFGIFTGCSSKEKEDMTFRIVALKGGRGETYLTRLVEEFQKIAPSDMKFDIKLYPNATINTELTSMINSGRNPDLLFLNPNMSGAANFPVEKFIKEKNVVDVSDVLDMTVPGESALVKDKLIEGILSNYTARPYGNGKTHLLPAFYSPTGLFYDASRFGNGQGQYQLPKTMNEFFALGDQLNTSRAQNSSVPHLFTYPTAGYFDGVMPVMLATQAGISDYEKCLGYTDGIWESANIKKGLEQIVKLRNYLEPNTVSQANAESFAENQQAVIGKADGSAKGTALFIPNGDWLPGEMSKTTPEGFKWGFTAWPKKDAEAMAYVNTFIETMFIHQTSDNQDLAKQFMAFYYSDKAAQIIAKESNAVIPTNAALENAKTNGITDEVLAYYDAYKDAAAVVLAFAATEPVEDVVWNNILFGTQIDEIMKSKDSTQSLVNSWASKLEAASDKLRAAIIR